MLTSTARHLLLLASLLLCACQAGLLSEKGKADRGAAREGGAGPGDPAADQGTPPAARPDGAVDGRPGADRSRPADTGAAAPPDQARAPDQAVARDTAPPQPDRPLGLDAGSGPAPPFGSTAGVTAANFTINYCDSAQFELHAQHGLYPAIVLLYSWTGFS